MPLTLVQQSRLGMFARAAVEAERRLGYPAEVLVGQWAVESGWGRAESGRFNVFGMTYNAARHRGFDMVPTREFVTWEQLQRFHPDELKTAKVIESGRPGTEPYQGQRWISIQRRFASYTSLAEAIDDKVKLITEAPRYAAAWRQYQADRNWAALIRGIAAAGYATAPNYAATVISVASSSEVKTALFVARKPVS